MRVRRPATSPTPRQSKPAAHYTAGGSFGSPPWMPRLEAVEITGFGIRQQYRYCLTKTEARKKLQELKNKFEKGGVKSINADKSTFASLAEKFKRERLVDAVYVGERKIAGRRSLSSPSSWLKQLLFFFGVAKLNEITKGRIEQFKLWLSQLPTRSQYPFGKSV
jgi:hypothetical protein